MAAGGQQQGRIRISLFMGNLGRGDEPLDIHQAAASW
jgi:hypothetical protein